MKAFDKLGQEITPGCLIVYGHALGRCAGLRIGKVLAIKWGYEDWRQGKKTQVAHFTVIGVDDDGGWGWKELKLARKGTLMFNDRIIVLHRDQIPEAYLALLDSIEALDEV